MAISAMPGTCLRGRGAGCAASNGHLPCAAGRGETRSSSNGRGGVGVERSGARDVGLDTEVVGAVGRVSTEVLVGGGVRFSTTSFGG